MTYSIALIGDSIFDNAGYVPGEPCVREQLSDELGDGFEVSLLAVDGDFVRDVAKQLDGLPAHVTHVVVSVGGNNALSYAQELLSDFESSSEMFDEWARIRKEFRHEYCEMLRLVVALGLKVTVCTIYDAVPSIDDGEATGLTIFNDVIISEAIGAGVPLVDLRQVCTEIDDYSRLSPIEPSSQGGAKIVAVLSRMLKEHDYASGKTVVYAG